MMRQDAFGVLDRHVRELKRAAAAAKAGGLDGVENELEAVATEVETAVNTIKLTDPTTPGQGAMEA